MDNDVQMQEIQVPEFHLAASLEGHKQDVRAATGFVNPSTNELIVATASRDRTVKLWKPFATGDGILFKTLVGHEHFVASVEVIPPANSFIPGMICIASGSNDKLIIIWDLETGKPALSLIGHSDTVCCLAFSKDGNLVSGSWDKTIRIWNGSTSIAELKGHSLAVWAVLSLDNGDIVSGAADKSIKIWRNKTCLNTLSKHTDVVRSLSILPNIGFASCANDGLIYTWTNSGECLQELNGHSSFIYSISTLKPLVSSNNSNSTSTSSSSSSGALELISGSEDRTVRVWRSNVTEQSIMHPGSVWDVSALPNGDFISACSDGVARVWSRDPLRKASEEVTAIFQHSLSSQAIPSGTIGDIQADKLPGIEALKNPGTKDQQNKMIRNGTVVELYQWSASSNEWNKVGEVVDARSQSKQILNGKEFDFVFDVDIGDGMMRKLGYNNGENPYVVAQQFLWDNELNQEWLDQVAQFVTQNAKPITLGVGEDPTVNSTTTSTYKDPYTGGGRYVPGSETQANVSTTNSNNFPKSVHFPLKHPVVFDTANYQAILNGALQFNEQLKKENSSLAIINAESTALSNMIDTLSEKSKYHVTSFSDLEFNLLLNKLIKWPAHMRFPMMDILRLIALHPDGSRKLRKEKNLLELVDEAAFKETPIPSKMMGLRFFTNLFQWGNTFDFVLVSGRNKIMERIAELVKSENKNVRLATAYLLQNYSNNLPTGNSREDAELQIISLLVEAVNFKETEEEIIYRTLVSIGSLVHNNCLELVKNFGLTSFVQENLKSNSSRVKEACTDLLRILK